jgi:hypothetical protein
MPKTMDVKEKKRTTVHRCNFLLKPSKSTLSRYNLSLTFYFILPLKTENACPQVNGIFMILNNRTSHSFPFVGYSTGMIVG